MSERQLGTQFPGNERFDLPEGWIAHDGKGMPVGEGVLVDALYRDDTVVKRRASALHGTSGASMSDWVWSPTEDDECDIVAYRVVEA